MYQCLENHIVRLHVIIHWAINSIVCVVVVDQQPDPQLILGIYLIQRQQKYENFVF